MTIEFALLGLLDRAPMHGYELHRAFSALEGVGLVWTLKLGLLYALLDKLEAAGLVTASTVAGENSPPRREFSLTPAGRAAYLEWRQTPVSKPRQMSHDFLARLYFAGLAGAAPARQLLQRQRQACLGWLENLHGQAHSVDAGHPFEQYVFDFRIRHVQAMLDWVEACDRSLAP
jgi:DNA-binding PadR family transcriptional regulator